MGLLIFFFLISIFFSFLCSIWEAVLLSITPTVVEIKYREGHAVGKSLKHLKDNIDRPLAAILTLNTIAHTVGAIGVGAQGVKIWGDSLMTAVVIPVAMTLGILLLSEIIPKTLGANYWERLIPFTIRSLRVVMLILYPFVIISQFITRALKKDKSRSVLSRSDFSTMAEIGAQEGVFQQEESRIIQNLIRFDTIRTKDIMTPRTVVKAAPEDMTTLEFHQLNKNLRFSRIPIYRENIDDITGFILKDDLLTNIINHGGKAPLKEIRRDMLVVIENLHLPELFNQLMEKREHIALVVNEFGGMQGLVTMEDVLETLLGMEILDEFDNIADMQLLARKNWEKRAKALGIIPPEQVE
ncbi:MAG: HlyC/CorC family transporter [Saprospirales bacterium]|nr:HlyC/CorC family transporter [Saprospirales bacterium]